MKKNGVKARRGKWWVIGAPYVWLMLMLMMMHIGGQDVEKLGRPYHYVLLVY